MCHYRYSTVMWLLTKGKKDNITPRREEMNYPLYAIAFNNNSLYVCMHKKQHTHQ
jgi:hypothetical protein